MSGVLGGLLFTAVNILVTLLQLRVLLQHLPLKVAGIWIVVINLGNYIVVLDLGLAPTLGREISFAVGNPDFTEEQRRQRIRTLISSCTAALGLFAVLVAIVDSVLGWVYLRTISPAALHGSLSVAWMIFVVGSALNLVGQGWYAGIYGFGQVFQEKALRSAGLSLGLLLMVVALYAHLGLVGLASAALLQSACMLTAVRVALSRVAPYVGWRGEVDWRTIRGLIVPSLKYAAMILGGLMILQTDNIVIASVLGPAQVPDYQAIAKVIGVLMSLSMMLVTSSAPVVSQAHAKGDNASIVQITLRNVRVTVATMITLGAYIGCYMDRVIRVWLGPHHFVGFAIVWVMLAVMLLEAHHVSLAVSTMAAGHIVFLAPALIGGVLSISFSIVMAHHYGLLGVALGTMMAQVLTNNWYVPYYTLRVFGIPWLQYGRRVVVPGLLLLLLTLGINFATRTLTRSLPDLGSLSVGGATAVVAGVVFFGFTMLSGEERGALLRRLRARKIARTDCLA